MTTAKPQEGRVLRYHTQSFDDGLSRLSTNPSTRHNPRSAAFTHSEKGVTECNLQL
jgi:hypothetical protein